MTDLQLSLFASGGVLVVGVFAFNKWQEYKAKKTVENAFGDGDDDALLSPSDTPVVRQEPKLSPEHTKLEPALEPHSEQEAASTAVGTDDVSGTEAEADTETVAVAVKVHAKELPVDELIDCVIPLEFDIPVRGEKLLAEIAELKYVGKKPVHFVGITAAGDKDVIATGGAYTTLLAGIQMVSRSGPLNELEYSEFVMKLRAIADNLSAHPDVPDMNRVISNAKELHQFVSEHDAQLSVNIAANGAAWALNTLLAALEKMGFDQRPDGRLMMPDGDGGSLFTLSTNVGVSETMTSRLTLLLDVPCVAPARDGFGAMAACARSLATRLGGIVVDDGNRPISKEALDEIAGQVSEFYGAMEEAQVPAGSVRAQRLFS